MVVHSYRTRTLMFNTDSSRIKIALAGHTGVGKTTLISTLRKANSGKIGDMANTTKKAVDYNFPEYKSLHATFVDCPGFQNASEMLHYLRAKNKGKSAVNEFRENCKEDNLDVEYDIRAVEALQNQNSDVVLYVADVRSPADESNITEVKVIQKIQPQIIVILNKAVEFEKSHGQDDTIRRIQQWKGELTNKVDIKLENIIVFDAHWDKPSKVQEIYKTILKILPGNRRSLFQEGLNEFEKYQAQIEQNAYKLLTQEVINIRYKTLKQKITDSRDKAKKELEEDIKNLLNDSTSRFIKKASQIYEIGAKNPTIAVSQFLENTRENREEATARQRISDAALGASLGGVAISAAYAGFFAIATVLTGGAAAAVIAAAGAGAAFGGGVGALGGSIIAGATAEGDRVYQLSLRSGVPEYLAEICITFIYALSHYGYGAFGSEMRDEDKKIASSKIEELLNKVQQINKERNNKLDWSLATESEIIKWSEETLKKLESLV
jgi:GTPase Era involved in 16S rRNA processing